jgi:signal transduction histidine kinase
VQVGIMMDMFLFTIALQKKIADNEKALINAAYNRQQAVLVERERIIADLHDDVGGGLSSIRMMSDLMMQKSNLAGDTSFALFGQKISATAKDIAQRMHTIIWSLNAENDTLENFSEYVRQYGVSFFENAGISFKYNAIDLPEGKQLGGVLRKNLFLIIKESFHNIIKHSNADMVTVTIATNKNVLAIEVIDNGKKQQNDSQPVVVGSGNGVKNMKKRMDEIGGSIHFSTVNGMAIYLEVRIA